MHLTFLGHMSWMLGFGEHHVLVDPVLAASFGTTAALQFAIDPAREVDIGAMPRVEAILLTTEHIQHFQPRTFRKLAERGHRPPVHVHRMFPSCASEVLQGLGFEVVRHADGEEARLGPWGVAFFSHPHKAHFWDSRVAALVVRDPSHAVLIQSDTLPSPSLAAHVQRCAVPLRAVVATCNAGAVEEGSGAGLSNALPILDRAQRGAVGVRLLAGALIEPFRALPPTAYLLVAGSGYKDARGSLRAPARALRDMVEVADALSLGTRVVAPLPGERIHLDDDRDRDAVAWVRRETTPEVGPSQAPAASGRLSPVFPGGSARVDPSALRELARAIVGAPFGRELLRVGHYLGRWLGPERFVLQFVDGEGADLLLDLSIVDFVRRPLSGDAALRTFPFGVRTTEADFVALLEGRLQIWELSMVGARQWYVCDRFHSPMACLYSTFNEAVRQDLARAAYAHEVRVL